ncbi:hypothetical protein REH65_27685 [Saccharopolyspora sp. ID03-671]|uniref:hypothetical protein n=1 Tax=Saccharopolyspora sp. ID03-671 TaxID=3073066 RepID=UPI0032524144
MTIEKEPVEKHAVATDVAQPEWSAVPPRQKRDRAVWLVAAGALLAGLLFVVVDVHYNGGRYIPSLDDAYIHLQYGKQIGQGEFLRFHDGEPISTGASSLLYVLVLGALHAVGMHGGLLMPAAVLLGIVCHAATAAGVLLLGQRLVNRTTGRWAGALVAFSGPMLWGATSGMEITLTAFLLVATLLMVVREAPTAVFRWTPVLAALAALSRMEALAFLAVLVPLMMHACRRRAGLARIGAMAWCLLPFAVVGAQLLFYRLATGHASPNGSQSKSLTSIPHFNLGEFVGKTSENFSQFLQILSGLTRQDFVLPGALLLAAVGMVALTRHDDARRYVGLTIGIGTVLALGAISTMGTALWQQVRYLQPFLPLFLLVTVIGIGAVVGWLRLSGRAATAILLVAALFTAVSVPLWAHVMVVESASIRERLVSLAAWAKGGLPEGARLGVHDVGAAAYLSGHPTVDLVGLTTNDLAEPALNGMGSLYEELRTLPPEKLPDYVAAYDAMPGGIELDKLAAAGVYTDPVLATPQITVWKTDWSLFGSGDQPETPVQGRIRDRVNVGSMDSERAHDHHLDAARSDFPPMTELRTVDSGGRRMVDSARHIWGEEEFTLHHLEPGRPVHLIARHDASGPKGGFYTGMREVRVFAGDVDLGKHELVPDPKGWNESVIEIPAHLVTSPDLTVRMGATQEFVGPYPDYKSFGYWAVQ